MKCPSCAVNAALRKQVEAKGWTLKPTPCKVCKGAGEIPDHTPLPAKRLKDLSGEEWTERSRADEWKEYLNDNE